MGTVRSVVNRILSTVGLIRDPELKEVIARSDELRAKINERLDLADAIRAQAERDERRIRERLR